MNENEHLAKAVNEQLNTGSPIILVSVINVQGSTPRHEGTKMAVGVDGKTYGTIGGSLIEAATIQESKKVFTEMKSKVLSFELTGKDATAPGMICGGTAEILLDYITPSELNRRFSGQWYDTTSQGKDFYILTHLKGKNETFQVLGHAILQTDKDIFVSTSLTSGDIVRLKKELYTVSSNAFLWLDDTQVMVDRIRKLKTLYCFGAGHVALPTVRIAAMVGFRAIVLDDRLEYANTERFPEAYSMIIVKDYNHALDGFEIDDDSYIVIFTRSHQYDRIVLEQSLKTSAGYIGMISSKRKREAIYEALMANGVKKERLDRVHSPIGIDIGGETPEEIAVSIVAELIQVRSRQSEK
jgi:xanthine dehydrogenase accessory factor